MLVLRAFFALEIIAMITTMATVLPQLNFGIYCVILDFPDRIAGFMCVRDDSLWLGT